MPLWARRLCPRLSRLISPCRPPEAMAEIVGLKNRKCVPCEGGVQALGESDINRLQKQVGTRWGAMQGAAAPVDG